MMEDLETDFIVAWDGGHILAVGNGDNPDNAAVDIACLAIAHTTGHAHFVGIWRPSDGLAILQLPEHCRHVDIRFLTGESRHRNLAIDLDEMLLPGFADADVSGMRTIHCLTGPPSEGLRLTAEGEHPNPASSCLNLVLAGGGESRRIKAGPLVEAGKGLMPVSVEASYDGSANSMRLRFMGLADDRPTPLVAHILAAAARNARDLDPVDPALRLAIEGRLDDLASGLMDLGQLDATGLNAVDSFRRGFRLLAPVADDAEGERVLTFGEWSEGDEIVAFAPRGTLMTLAGKAGDGAGSRIIIREENGEPAGHVVTMAYRPATSTAMSAVGASGGKALAIHSGQGVIAGSLVETASDLAEAVWARARSRSASAAPSFLEAHADNHAAPSGDDPLSMLAHQASSLKLQTASPVIAALGPLHGLNAPLLEELDAMPVEDRVVCLRWFVRSPAVAIKAVRARVRLSFDEAAFRTDQIMAILAWHGDEETPAQLEKLAGRIERHTDGESRRSQLRLLREVMEAADAGWVDLADLVEAHRLLLVYPVPQAASGAEGSLGQLLQRLRNQSEVIARAQAMSANLDLAELSRLRSELPQAARNSGEGGSLAAEIVNALNALSPADILLLHGHLDGVRHQQDSILAIRRAIDALDVASGGKPLAARMDRNGDPLIGMTRIARSSAAVIPALLKVPAARQALVALNAWIAKGVPAEQASHPTVATLRRGLQGYACFRLLGSIVAECDDAALSHADEDGAMQAARLRSGLSETLPQYVAAAMQRLGEEHQLGHGFIERLAVISDQAAAGQ